MKSLASLILCCLSISANAATVLTNLGAPVQSTLLVKGTGGFLPPAIEFGFEFTVGGGDHQLTTITLAVGNHTGSVPLTVELFGSPTGPDAATLLTSMVGPAQPSNQDATFTPAIPVLLADGETYFLRLSVAGSASTYPIPKTSNPAVGTFTMERNYQRNAGNSWGTGSVVSHPILEITATAVPEPTTMSFSSAALAILLRRRRS
jgi:hypothetical protein